MPQCNYTSTCSKKLTRYRTGHALREMKELPNFDKDFLQFVREECRLEADQILKNKDPPPSSFNLESLKSFDYFKELSKMEAVSPILVASISGAISASKDKPTASLTRKGFGGSRKDDDISLVPSIVQAASLIMRNRHPNSISTVPCINSINNWLQHVPHKYFFLQNALGFSFRYRKHVMTKVIKLFSQLEQFFSQLTYNLISARRLP